MADERLPIDWEKGVETFGDEDMMKTMVQNFEPLTFDPVMKDLAANLKEENWPEVKRFAHTLKGSSSYVGAFRFSEVCLLLQNAALDPSTQAPNFNAIYPAYDKVLKEGKILQSHLAKLLEKPPDNSTIDSYISEFEKLKKINTPKTLEENEKKKKGISIEKNEKTVEKKDIKKNEKEVKKEENTKENGIERKKSDRNKDVYKENPKENPKISPKENNKEKEKEKEHNINIKDHNPEEKEKNFPVLEGKEANSDMACCKQCNIF